LQSVYGQPETLHLGDTLSWTVQSAHQPFLMAGSTSTIGTGESLPENAGLTFTWNGTANGSPDLVNFVGVPSTFNGTLTDGTQGTYQRSISVTDGSGNPVCSTPSLQMTIQ
jgi:hypothetical protein